nr:MAG TPA: hypothetical protein [Caudoviricetes sp.]DAZ51551.1 MAG TPA: hypothetical protein [Caudoviricetes sp.]
MPNPFLSHIIFQYSKYHFLYISYTPYKYLYYSCSIINVQ